MHGKFLKLKTVNISTSLVYRIYASSNVMLNITLSRRKNAHFVSVVKKEFDDCQTNKRSNRVAHFQRNDVNSPSTSVRESRDFLLPRPKFIRIIII